MIRIVPHLDSTHSLIFDVIERDLLKTGKTLKMGRFTDRFDNPDRIAFKSKVVSRGHAEIWIENNRYYIRDTKSSSGTFLNRVRLSPPNEQSIPYLLQDGDIIQLGIDYQGGKQELFRCVKMRIEIKSPLMKESNSSYCLNSFKSHRKLTEITDSSDVEECCICLYAIAPFQALFVAPCSHTFHFKCCYPLLNNYPGFNCPLCRSYADLDANVAIEADEVIEMFKNITASDDDLPLQKVLQTVDKMDSSHVHNHSTTITTTNATTSTNV